MPQSTQPRRSLIRALATLLQLLLLAQPVSAAIPDDPESDLKQEFCRRALPGHGREISARDYDWDVLHTDLYLAPEFVSEALTGEVTFTISCEVASLSQLVLDFLDDMDVDSAFVDGDPVTWNHTADQLEIPLDPPVAMGEQFTLRVVFSGSPQSYGFGSFAWTVHDGVDQVSTLSEAEWARGWWPCKDVPDDKFTLDIRYRVPAQFKAPGPGLLQSVTDNGDGTHTWHWREDYPINTYLIALTVTDYDHYTDHYVSDLGYTLPIENYVYPENRDASEEALNVTPEIFAMLEELFGEYPFRDEKYGHMVFPWGGAMEHQTCTSYGNVLLRTDHRYDRIVVHELAHQWFGNGVTLQDWRNIWLNEGFAKYSEALWFEHREGQSGITGFMTDITSNPYFDGPVYNNPVEFGGTVYRKGAWVLHMLRFLVNDDDSFFAALRDYLARHMYGNAHTEDLRSDLESFLGLDLETYFAQWVYGVYRPQYEWGWTSTESGGNWTLDLIIRQVQENTGLFEMPLPFRVTTPTGPVDLRLDNRLWTQGYSIDLGPDQPLSVVLDPDNWILENSGEVAYDPTAAPVAPTTVNALRGNYPNPFNPRTRIEFSLQERQRVELAVFDIHGKLICTLVHGLHAAGIHGVNWDGLDSRGRQVASGLYLVRLTAGGEVRTGRMTLLR
jgi:aminopeptidase N